MKQLIARLESESATLANLLSCLKEIEANGDIFLFKVDGERDEMQATVMISFPGSDRDIIRYDSSNLKEAIIKTLRDYASISPLAQTNP